MTVLVLPTQQFRTNTAGLAPSAAALLEGQLAINMVDLKLFFKDHAGVVQRLGVALSDLATVATTGNYNDLINKPAGLTPYTLPAATATTLGGVIIPSQTGLTIDASGNLTNTGVLSVNTRTGAVTLTAADVGLPTDLLSGPSTTIAAKYLPASLTGALTYQGSWNANTNTPTLASGTGTKGYYYVVNVAGSTNLDGVNTWNIGDWAIFNGTIWQRLQNSGGTVTSVAGKTGAVTLVPGDITGLAAVASSGSYTDLTNKPTPYTLPVASTTVLGGVLLQTAANAAGNLAAGKLATVALTGNYSDLVGLPFSPNIANIQCNLQGNPNILNEVFYLFTRKCQFPQNWAGSYVTAQLISGTTATIQVWQYNPSNPTGVQVGTLNIDNVNGNSFTSTGTTTNFNPGDRISYRFYTTNITQTNIALVGTWQS